MHVCRRAQTNEHKIYAHTIDVYVIGGDVKVKLHVQNKLPAFVTTAEFLLTALIGLLSLKEINQNASTECSYCRDEDKNDIKGLEEGFTMRMGKVCNGERQRCTNIYRSQK